MLEMIILLYMALFDLSLPSFITQKFSHLRNVYQDREHGARNIWPFMEHNIRARHCRYIGYSKKEQGCSDAARAFPRSSISLVEDSVATPMASLVDVPYFTFQSPLGNRISFFAQSAQLISLMHSGSRRKPKPIFSATLEERPIRHLLSLCCGTLEGTVEHFLMAP